LKQVKRRFCRSDEITRLQRTFLLEKLVGLNDKDAALAAGYSLSVAENTKQKIWAKPGVQEQFEQLKERVRNVLIHRFGLGGYGRPRFGALARGSRKRRPEMVVDFPHGS
jgi:hypothetical protein